MWQAMLIAAGLPNSYQIVVNGFFTGEGGMKMSKSVGNVVNPYDVVQEFGVDALRYYVLGEVSMFEDSPCSMDLIKTTYNAKLANGLGNLVSRIMKMAENNLTGPVEIIETSLPGEYVEYFKMFEINKAVHMIWSEISALDLLIQDKQPFKLVKVDLDAGRVIIQELVARLYIVADMLAPILPETSEKIKILIKENKSPEIPLFLRKD